MKKGIVFATRPAELCRTKGIVGEKGFWKQLSTAPCSDTYWWRRVVGQWPQQEPPELWRAAPQSPASLPGSFTGVRRRRPALGAA